ncbi:PEGA domain-containing protein [Xylanibacter brevis]|uniref:PEGA domain-containing protein n=1 Tax=Xylanibacter brevis TaxID=83231 RepID=UPI0004825B3E|nr:PEGA domain-containing protein [Xylanibacter brevis]
MKKKILIFLMICASLSTYAQQLTVKSVNLRPQDARARTNPRDDAKGKKCAIIRVGVVGVENLVFPDAVGNVERSLSEYVVYVPDGLKSLNYKNKSGQEQGSINFDDYGLEINSLASYDVVFESEDRLRSAIFSIQPANATLAFDGKKVDVNKDGIAMINKPVGEYSYMVMADGYLGQSGTVTLTEDDISTVTDIILEQQLYPVTINVFPQESTVFIDNVPYSNELLSNLKLSEGKHSVRVTASNYQDDERSITVKSSMDPVYVVLKEAKHEVIKHKEERSRTNISIRNAFYITGGFAFTSASNVGNLFDGKNAFDFGLEFSAVQHFGGIFALREGASIGAIKSNKNESYIDFAYDIESDSLKWMWRVDVPLQFGVSLPFGSYNKHLFSIFGGGYARYIGLTDISESEYKFPDGYAKRGDVDDYIFDYGIRLSAKLDFSSFTIGADFSQSLNDLGFSAGVNVGVKLYSLGKKD